MAYSREQRRSYQRGTYTSGTASRNWSVNTDGHYRQHSADRTIKKHSGAKAGVDKNGNMYVRGWNYSKQFGMRTFYCAAYKKTKESTSGTGKTWSNIMVKVTTKNAKPFIVGGMYDHGTGKVTVSELGLVINPKAPNGGYCGQF